MRRVGHRLTPQQVRGPWTFIGNRFDAPNAQGQMTRDHGIEISGVIIDPDGDVPGHRVMVADMQGEALKRRPHSEAATAEEFA